MPFPCCCREAATVVECKPLLASSRRPFVYTFPDFFYARWDSTRLSPTTKACPTLKCDAIAGNILHFQLVSIVTNPQQPRLTANYTMTTQLHCLTGSATITACREINQSPFPNIVQLDISLTDGTKIISKMSGGQQYLTDSSLSIDIRIMFPQNTQALTLDFCGISLGQNTGEVVIDLIDFS